MPCVDKQTVLKFAHDDEERLALARTYDALICFEKTGCEKHTPFLSPLHKSKISQAFLKEESLSFYGGYDEAERVVAYFSNEGELPKIKAIKAEGKFNMLSHRDFLGSILSLGITRDNIGDICISGDECVFFVLEKMAEYIMLNLREVKKEKVRLSLYDSEQIAVKREYEEIKKSVASLRADAVVGAIFNLSRADASNEIRKGLVSLNYKILSDTSKKIKQNDVFSLKGKGKAKISEAGEISKKGRVFITIKKYK